MKTKSIYKEYNSKIKKEEFMILYPSLGKNKWFSEQEEFAYSFPQNASSLAGRYLIKKDLTDFLKKQDYMSEIEILNDNFGKPKIHLGSNILQLMKRSGISKIDCSISHSRKYITALTLISF